MGVGGTAVGTSYQRGGLMTLSSSEENGCVRKAKSVAAICLPHVRKITFISLSKHTDTHLQTLAAARVPPPPTAPSTAGMSKFLHANLGLSGRGGGFGLKSDR